MIERVGLNVEDTEEGAHHGTASSLGQRVMHSTPSGGRNYVFFSPYLLMTKEGISKVKGITLRPGQSSYWNTVWIYLKKCKALKQNWPKDSSLSFCCGPCFSQFVHCLFCQCAFLHFHANLSPGFLNKNCVGDQPVFTAEFNGNILLIFHLPALGLPSNKIPKCCLNNTKWDSLEFKTADRLRKKLTIDGCHRLKLLKMPLKLLLPSSAHLH